MKQKLEKTIIISLGGSLLVPGEIDTDFIRTFTDLIARHSDRHTFYIITGGGKICRVYQDALKRTAEPTADDLDWIGIHVTRLNAAMLRLCFGDLAAETVFTDPRRVEKTEKRVVIGAGWQPGWSTDFVATELAREVSAHAVINLSNIDRVYTADPKKYPSARPISGIAWPEYRKLIPDEWDPGLNSPFDPVASKSAEDLALDVVVMGPRLEQLERYLRGEDFEGTLIHP